MKYKLGQYVGFKSDPSSVGKIVGLDRLMIVIVWLDIANYHEYEYSVTFPELYPLTDTQILEFKLTSRLNVSGERAASLLTGV
jgi:hypothetical protein